jgi:hypothetical protein
VSTALQICNMRFKKDFDGSLQGGVTRRVSCPPAVRPMLGKAAGQCWNMNGCAPVYTRPKHVRLVATLTLVHPNCRPIPFCDKER